MTNKSIVFDHAEVAGRLGPINLHWESPTHKASPARFGVIGRSGSGKTTLVSLIMGMIQPTSGSVRSTFSSVSFIPQDPGFSLLPHLPVSESVLEPVRISGGNIAEARRRLPEAFCNAGLDPQLKDRLPCHLSGGQRQRVAIARALITHPDLIVADEAFSALDVSTRSLMEQAIIDSGAMVVFVSHDISTLTRLCTDVVMLSQGSVVTSCPVEELGTASSPELSSFLKAAEDLML